MVEQGFAIPHHGHDPRAVEASAALEREEQARLDALVAADVVAAETAARALVEKRMVRTARHERELAARRPRRRAL